MITEDAMNGHQAIMMADAAKLNAMANQTEQVWLAIYESGEMIVPFKHCVTASQGTESG